MTGKKNIHISQRNPIIDICRSIGIILVVVGHSGCPDILKSWIYLFHMSLFFALSGYCYNIRYDEHPVGFIIKKIKSIYLPYVIFSIGLIFFHNFFIKSGLYGSSESFLLLQHGNEYGMLSTYTIKDICINLFRTVLFASNEEFGGSTWFLRILFVINVVYVIFRFLVKKFLKIDNKKDIYISVLLGTAALLIGCGCDLYNIHLPLELQTCFSAFFAFEVGIVFKSFTNIVSFKSNISIPIFTGIVLFGLTYVDSIGLGLNSVGKPWFYFIVTVVGLIFVYSLSLLIYRYIYNCVPFLVNIGKHSLSIVFFHFMAFKIITVIQIVMGEDPIHLACFPVCNSHGLWWIIYSVTGVLIPIILAVFYERVRNGIRDGQR